jgi:hypothetical protein
MPADQGDPMIVFDCAVLQEAFRTAAVLVATSS